MEQSKLISIVIAKFKVAYPYYFKELSEEEFLGLISMYQEELSGYNEQTLSVAVKSIIRKRKFMPSLQELIEECENSRCYRANYILDIMYKTGYFSKGEYGELPSEHAFRNYEKATMWVNEGIIPEWLLFDMKKYGYEDTPLLNGNQDRLRISGGEV